MRGNKIQDERIILERQKIQSTAYIWIVTILLISIIVQQFFMNAPFAQYAVEFFVLIGCGLYNIISNFNKGIDIWNPSNEGKKKLVLNTVVSGIISAVLFTFLSGKYDVMSSISYFVTFVTFFLVVRLVMIKVNDLKQYSIEKKLNEDEEEMNE